jgi:hypothetical protein
MLTICSVHREVYLTKAKIVMNLEAQKAGGKSGSPHSCAKNKKQELFEKFSHDRIFLF